jgi:hypothetical protein
MRFLTLRGCSTTITARPHEYASFEFSDSKVFKIFPFPIRNLPFPIRPAKKPCPDKFSKNGQVLNWDRETHSITCRVIHGDPTRKNRCGMFVTGVAN